MSFNNTNSFFESQESEKNFAETCRKNNILVTPSSEKSNIEKHVDFYLTYPFFKKEVAVDFKGAKRKSRNDSTQNFDIVWIEIQNVKGNKGWLYGEANEIVFERGDHYLFIPKILLQKYTDSIKDKEIYYTKNLEKFYQRKNRQDIIYFTTFERMFAFFPNKSFFYLKKLDN